MEKRTRAAEKKKSTPSLSALRRLPWRRIFIWSGAAAAAALLLFCGFVLHLIAVAPDIDLISVSPAESATYICGQDGSCLRRLTLASSNRDIVSLEEIPDSLQKAVIAIEDERFYRHSGIDVRGIARAFVSGVFSGSFSEGASTITQQLIKNNVFTEWTQETSFSERLRRKIQEQYLALQLEKRISKEEILEDYLNTINLGAGCYGVQSAAMRYFGKDVSELTVPESAVLAAIPQNPTRYNPITNPEENRARRDIVLDYMVRQGYLSEEEKEDALRDDVYARIRTADAAHSEASVYSYYEDALIDQAINALITEKGFSSEQASRAVYSGGLRIFSAQDSALQQICDEEFQDPDNFPEGTEFGIDYALSVSGADGQVTNYGSESLRSYVRENLNPEFDLLSSSQEEAQGYADAFRESVLSSGSAVLGERLSLSPQPQASLVLMDQSTGLVRAIVGGRGEKTASLTLNRATETARQPGSTFKILTAYAPAIDAFGQTLATLYENEPFQYEDGTPVSNWDITDYSGTVTVREAITRSINVVAVRCITEISPRTGFEYARRFGISTLHESYESAGGVSSDVIQPLALGGITQGVTNLELCSAYAAVANGGVYRTPKFFTKILDRQGNVLIDWTGGGAEEEETQRENEANLAEAAASAGSGSAQRDSVRILADSTAFLLTDAMKDVVSSPDGTAFGSVSAGAQPVAGKTGTTSSYKDIWFVGYTPFYTCCVWGGYDNNQALPDGSVYHSYNKILWSAVMDRVHSETAASDFEIPDSVVPMTLCRESHLPAVHGGCMDTYVEYFARGTEPEQKCPLHPAAPLQRKRTALSGIQSLLRKESESETESESEAGYGTVPGADAEPGRETGLGSGSESEAQYGTVPGADAEPERETGPGAEPESEYDASSGAGFKAEPEHGAEAGPAETLPGGPGAGQTQPNPSANSAQPQQNRSGQPDTNSLEDLMNRLTGSSSGYGSQGLSLP